MLGLGKTPALNAHGVKHGWCYWPFNFDPIWIDACIFFSRKEVKHEESATGSGSESESVRVPVPNAN